MYTPVQGWVPLSWAKRFQRSNVLTYKVYAFVDIPFEPDKTRPFICEVTSWRQFLVFPFIIFCSHLTIKIGQNARKTTRQKQHLEGVSSIFLLMIFCPHLTSHHMHMQRFSIKMQHKTSPWALSRTTAFCEKRRKSREFNIR